MNQQTKSAIKSLVLDLRHTLEDELAIALRRRGIYAERSWISAEKRHRGARRPLGVLQFLPDLGYLANAGNGAPLQLSQAPASFYPGGR